MKKTRILLISDIHCTTEQTAKELKEISPIIKGSLANGPILGYTQRERMEFMLKCIEQEHKKSPLDAILIPGDLSIDDYDFRCLPRNYCDGVKKDYLDRFPVPYDVIPGNHDSYPDVLWHKVFDTHRQFSVVVNGVLYLMADTYARTPAWSASGSPYVPLDLVWAKREMEKYPDLPVFLVAHFFNPRAEGEDFSSFLAQNSRIRGLIMGHTHRFEVLENREAFGGKPVFDIGGFSYYTQPTNGVWDFNMFHAEWRWGYQLLELDDTTFRSWHVFPAVHYHAHNGEFDMPEEITETKTYPLFDN